MKKPEAQDSPVDTPDTPTDSRTPVATVTADKPARAAKRRAPRRAPGRPTTDQSDEIGDALLSAALRSFMELGFEGTTMDVIAKEAKVARITVYRRFGDKRELFRQVSHFAQRSMNGHLQELTSVEGPPETVLRGLISQMLDIHLRPDYLSIMRMAIFESPRFPEVAMAYWGEVGFALRPLTDYLERLKQDHVISVPSARDAALQFATLAVGGVRYLMVRPSQFPGSREHWVESVYTTFARSWGLDSSHLADIQRPAAAVPAAKAAPRSKAKAVSAK